MKKLKIYLSFLFLISIAGLYGEEGLSMNPLFSSHAVLQNGVTVPVWGKALPKEKVTVSFGGQSVAATADDEGRWKAILQPLAVSAEPRKMTIKAGAQEIVLEDVLVGEVWLVSGRSNIGFSVSRMTDSTEEIAKADQPNLRLLQVATKDPSLVPQESFTSKGWAAANPQTVKGFSAVGWVFGSELQKAKNVPVGIVMSSWGGSQPVMWIEKDGYEAAKGKKDETTAASQQSIQFEKESQSYHKAGDGQSAEKIGGKPGACFNTHILPLIPMAMKGVLVFFDGAVADDIRLLSENWRKLWGSGDFPFLFVQVHRQGGEVETDPNAKSDSARSSYLSLLKKIPKSAMVVALDTGVEGKKDIHPMNKRPVGERAALAARAIAYGESIVYSGPIFSKAVFQGNQATIFFDHVGGGLVAKEGELDGFAVSSDKKNWVWGKAEISGDKVVVTADGISHIVAVRYAYAGNNPKGNLYNKEGLPASPFVSE